MIMTFTETIKKAKDKFIETESGLVIARDLAGGRELVFNAHRVSIWEDKKSSADGYWGWLHNKGSILVPLNCTVKNGYNGTIYVCIRYHNK